MDIGLFYALFSSTCFTLVGLWWNVVDRRSDWNLDPLLRRLAGGVYLSFLLPGLMGLFAQINPQSPVTWRVSFGTVGLVGCWMTVRLVGATRGSSLPGPFSRNRWVLVVVYGLIVVLGAFPQLARPLGLAPIQVAAMLLIVVVLLGHGLTWEFMKRPEPEPRREVDEPVP